MRVPDPDVCLELLQLKADLAEAVRLLEKSAIKFDTVDKDLSGYCECDNCVTKRDIDAFLTKHRSTT